MTSKTFKALAAEFAALKDTPGELGYNEHAEGMRCCLARRVAAVCQQSNDRFDRSRFLAACEVPE